MDQFLAPLLNRIPGGWKTATGLLAMLVIQVLLVLGKIDQATADHYYNYAVLLTGVGLYHKTTTKISIIRPEKGSASCRIN